MAVSIRITLEDDHWQFLEAILSMLLLGNNSIILHSLIRLNSQNLVHKISSDSVRWVLMVTHSVVFMWIIKCSLIVSFHLFFRDQRRLVLRAVFNTHWSSILYFLSILFVKRTLTQGKYCLEWNYGSSPFSVNKYLHMNSFCMSFCFLCLLFLWMNLGL